MVVAAAKEVRCHGAPALTLTPKSRPCRHLRDGFDVVAASHEEGRDRGGGERGADGVALLLEVHAPVPPAPGLLIEEVGRRRSDCVNPK